MASNPKKPNINRNKSRGNQGQKRQDNSIDLSKYMDKKIRVKFTAGGEAIGILKGYDQLLNIVLDGTMEERKLTTDGGNVSSDEKRKLGLVVCRGPNITSICPDDGFETTVNPFS
ncbi:hypothetical protein SNEBB_009250 [Seison nebaliae]|nr:hypothetical protein SNEBB_009250 [Seison nebaliae]